MTTSVKTQLTSVPKTKVISTSKFVDSDAKMYSESYQTSKMELFAKTNVNNLRKRLSLEFLKRF